MTDDADAYAKNQRQNQWRQLTPKSTPDHGHRHAS